MEMKGLCKAGVVSGDSTMEGGRRGIGRYWRGVHHRTTARDPTHDNPALGRLILEGKKNSACQYGMECTLDAVNKFSMTPTSWQRRRTYEERSVVRSR